MGKPTTMQDGLIYNAVNTNRHLHIPQCYNNYCYNIPYTLGNHLRHISVPYSKIIIMFVYSIHTSKDDIHTFCQQLSHSSFFLISVLIAKTSRKKLVLDLDRYMDTIGTLTSQCNVHTKQ